MQPYGILRCRKPNEFHDISPQRHLLLRLSVKTDKDMDDPSHPSKSTHPNTKWVLSFYLAISQNLTCLYSIWDRSLLCGGPLIHFKNIEFTSGGPREYTFKKAFQHYSIIAIIFFAKYRKRLLVEPGFYTFKPVHL